jgi:hypothetical protein
MKVKRRYKNSSIGIHEYRCTFHEGPAGPDPDDEAGCCLMFFRQWRSIVPVESKRI